MNDLNMVPPPAASAGPVAHDDFNAVIQAWDEGAPPDAQLALEQHPMLLAHKSQVIDLAYAEFCRRRDAGEPIDPEEFCERFPGYRSSLRSRMRGGQLVEFIEELIPQKGPAKGPVQIFWPEVGDAFHEYSLLRELGRGSFARVYLATEASTGDRPVVVKLSLYKNAEGRTQGRLSHEHIVPVLSAREYDGDISMVCMPYLGSATLQDVLDRAYPKRGGLPPRHARIILDTVRAAVRPGDPTLDRGTPAAYLSNGTWTDAVAHIGERLAVALAFVHKDRVRHRDLKPSNILLDAAAKPLLMDFNLSDDERIDSSRVGGTLPYMAPEQLRRFLHPDTAPPSGDSADLYALGVILYELLTGHHPLGKLPETPEGVEMVQLLLERQQSGPTPIQKLNPQVDRELARLIESCLAFEEEDRPASAEKMAQVLQRRLAPSRFLRVLAAAAIILSLATTGGVLAFTPPSNKNTEVAPQAAPLTAEEEYKRGCAAYDAGDFEKADDCFDRALKLSPKDERFLFASGRCRVARNNPTGAMARFSDAYSPGYFTEHQKREHLASLEWVCGPLNGYGQAYRQHSDGGWRLAALAYSELLCGQYRGALVHAREAEQDGFASLAFFTTRAVARQGTKYPANNYNDQVYEEAEADLERVLNDYPNYVPGRYNRAMLQFNWWLFKRQDMKKNANAVIPRQAVGDIEFVIADLSPNGEYAQLHLDAAHIYAGLGAGQQPGDVSRGLQHLQIAVRSGGLRKSKIDKDMILENGLDAAQFKALADSFADNPDTSKPLPRSLRMPDPIQGWLEY